MGEGEIAVLPDETTKNIRRRKKKLYSSILCQMEFYFSDSNLTKDRFLSQLLVKSPYIDINIFLNFNKIRKLNCTVDDIRKAILKSEIIEVTEDNKICRKKPVKLKDNVDSCTIYVENIKADATHDWLRELFSEFGKVTYVSLPKYKQTRVNKGFAFVEFETEEDANQTLLFFESIDLKMPSNKEPEELRSIVTFEADGDTLATTEGNGAISSKRKFDSESDSMEDSKETKKHKTNQNCETGLNNESKPTSDEEEDNIRKDKADILEKATTEGDSEGKKKKKKNKRDKKTAVIKEHGIQILSKKEWKKLRNKYLDLQKKKMKEFKNYLYKEKFGQKITDKSHAFERNTNTLKEEQKCLKKLEFLSGVIVKVKTEEPCTDVKKLKAELKLTVPDVKYIDIPFPGSQTLFLRFGEPVAASEFCSKNVKLENLNVTEKTALSGEEEETYWQRMEESRTAKFQKQNKKQRGRDKLLKKANKEQHGMTGSHVRFEESTE